jgi:hypothetical protein
MTDSETVFHCTLQTDVNGSGFGFPISKWMGYSPPGFGESPVLVVRYSFSPFVFERTVRTMQDFCYGDTSSEMNER